MTFLLIAALVCPDPKIAECRTACRFEGYTSGYYRAGRCLCIDSYLYSDFLEKREKKALPLHEGSNSADGASL